MRSDTTCNLQGAQRAESPEKRHATARRGLPHELCSAEKQDTEPLGLDQERYLPLERKSVHD